MTPPTWDGPRVYRGIDISHWQDPDAIDWDALSEIVDFVVCRFTYGTRPDRRVAEHVERVRRHGLSLGAYHFFRPHLDPRAQLDAFRAVDDAVGYEPADLVPWLDIERDPGAPPPQRDVSPAWSDSAQTLCHGFVDAYGECMPYLNEADFLALGSPRWVLDRPLAVAHWTERPQPRTPGGVEAVIWQRRVAPLPPATSLPIDQNLARQLIHVPHPGPLGMTRGEVSRVMGLVALTLDQTIKGLPRP